MSGILALVVLIVIAAALFVRFAPSDPDRWHLDPAGEADPGAAGLRLVGRDAPRFPGHPDDVLATLIEIARAAPRTRLLEGGVDEGMVTFVTRSAVWGFPDFTTVKATDEGTVTKLALLARSRFGRKDFGVNSERVEAWLHELDAALR